jgi:hypothetical protein
VEPGLGQGLTGRIGHLSWSNCFRISVPIFQHPVNVIDFTKYDEHVVGFQPGFGDTTPRIS